MKRIGLVVGLALVGFACEGRADRNVTCNKSLAQLREGFTVTSRWAEFPVEPGKTEVTVCWPGHEKYKWPPRLKTHCTQEKATWHQGTKTGYVTCGFSVAGPDGTVHNNEPDPISITVHR